MHLKMFPYALGACLVLGLYSVSAFAQNRDIRARQIKQTAQIGDPARIDDDPVIISVAENVEATAGEEIKPTRNLILTGVPRLGKFRPLISEAIDDRLGARYHWGSTGPNRFDCSGFVWATFHAAGIDFERGSARTLFARFEAPAPEENYKFGTLVFFSGLTHVGIVADENGFYHASRHHGVVYAAFDDYWRARIDGFRRVPLPVPSSRTED